MWFHWAERLLLRMLEQHPVVGPCIPRMNDTDRRYTVAGLLVASEQEQEDADDEGFDARLEASARALGQEIDPDAFIRMYENVRHRIEREFRERGIDMERELAIEDVAVQLFWPLPLSRGRKRLLGMRLREQGWTRRQVRLPDGVRIRLWRNPDPKDCWHGNQPRSGG